MFDPDVVDLCMHCLVGAAVHEGPDADLSLSATALARDLADTHRVHAIPLLDAAAHAAVRYLDASELGAAGFAAALRRLSSLRGHVHAKLAGFSPAVRPLAA
jgi:hypothetical protein